MRLVESLLGLTLILALPELPMFGQSNAQPGAKQDIQPAGEGAAQNARPVYSIFEGTIVEMPWPEIKKAAERNALVVLPIGVIEEHGPHMGPGIDTYVAWQFSKLLKEKLRSQNIEAVVLPPMYWGVMHPNESGAYPGSLRVRPETMKAILMDELADVKAWGFKNVFILNPHGREADW